METYFWRHSDYPNLGDEFTRILLEDLFRTDCRLVPMVDADLLSTGSTLGWIKPELFKGRKHPLNVVGSGFMAIHNRLRPSPEVKIHSVRGFLSVERIRVDRDAPPTLVGDPGLLLSDLPSVKPCLVASSEGKVGFIPHHSKFNSASELVQQSGLDYNIIDIRTDDVAGFSSQVLECDYIVSQSLHGLVFADSLQIPSVWLYDTASHGGGAFKFYDYFSTVGRPFFAVAGRLPTSRSELQSAAWVASDRRVAELKLEIYAAFHEAFDTIGL